MVNTEKHNFFPIFLHVHCAVKSRHNGSQATGEKRSLSSKSVIAKLTLVDYFFVKKIHHLSPIKTVN